ncbi:restriction endonuclease subunit S [Streptomyces sp. NPDC005955]|uniref:restriction endonuclease subunit S n=1 Tax=Streptomyces sp. NPDC005955 TaxID=3364738 RepID=UPI0036CB03D7
MPEREEVRLKDLISIKHGFAFKGEFFGDDPSGPILVTPGNFSVGGGFKKVKPKSYSGEIPEGCSLLEGDLIVTMTDLSKEADSLGYGALVPGDSHYLHNQRIGLVKVRDESRIAKGFLYYVLRTDGYRQHVIAGATGTTVKHTSPGRICDYSFRLPSLSEQFSIAAVLGALDDKIAVNERIAATYEALLHLRFAELGMTDEPDDAMAMPLTELITFNPKLAKPGDEEPIYVDMAALQASRAGIPTWSRRAPKSGSRFMNGDTLLARITPCLENGKTGYVDFMGEGEIGLGSTEFIVMRSRPGIPSQLSYFIARDARFRAHAIRNMVGTSGRQRVSAADASNYLVSGPDPAELEQFGRQASSAFEHMNSLEVESRTLATLRDTLLPQLMSGRLRVKDAEKIVEDQV